MIFESLTPYTKLIDIFVRDQDTWYDVKMLRSKVGWNNKKIYTGVGLLYKYDMLIKERRSTKSMTGSTGTFCWYATGVSQKNPSGIKGIRSLISSAG